MKKIFFALIFLSVLGAGALWWLMNSLPDPGKSLSSVSGEHGAEKAEEHGAEKVDGHEVEKVEEHETQNAEGHEAEKAEGHEAEKAEGHEAEKAEEHGTKAEHVVKVEDKGSEDFKKHPEKRKDLFAHYAEETKVNTDHNTVKKVSAHMEKPEKNEKHELTEKDEKLPIKTKELAEVKKEAAPAVKKAKSGRLNSSRYYVQVKALADKGSVSREEAKTLASSWTENTKGQPSAICPVDLLDRGKWVRVLLGPYLSLDDAKASLQQAQALSKEAFLVGDMECRL